jgi:hypothetical protein
MPLKNSLFLALLLLVLASFVGAQDPPSLEAIDGYGAIAVAHTNYVPQLDEALPKSVSAARLQERLRSEVYKRVARLEGYRLTEARGKDQATWLEVRVERVVLAKASLGDDAPALVVRARARLVVPGDGRSLYDERFEYRSPRQTRAQWRRNDAALLKKELTHGLRTVAQKASNEIFLRPMEVAKAAAAAPRPSAMGRVSDAVDESLALDLPRFINFNDTCGDAVASAGTLEALNGRVAQLLSERTVALRLGKPFEKDAELRSLVRRLPALTA